MEIPYTLPVDNLKMLAGVIIFWYLRINMQSDFDVEKVGDRCTYNPSSLETEGRLNAPNPWRRMMMLPGD